MMGAAIESLAVWLSSEYMTQGIPYTSVAQLKSNGAKNHWMVAGDSHIAYVGGLFDFARSNPNGFNLNLDTDLEGEVMNLSTTYALFYVSNGAACRLRVVAKLMHSGVQRAVHHAGHRENCDCWFWPY